MVKTKEKFKYGRFSTVVRASSAKTAWTTFYLSGLDLSEPNNDIWSEWNAIHYLAGGDIPWMTTGTGGSWEVHKEPESYPS